MHEESASGVSQAAVGQRCTEGIESARELILAVFRIQNHRWCGAGRRYADMVNTATEV